MKRLVIAGFGDIARRAAAQLKRRYALVPLARHTGFDLDRPETLVLEGGHALLHCAPPPAEGLADPRTAHLLAALEKSGILPGRVVYVSTSGVYGDCRGARIDESQPLAPATERARRRVAAEDLLTRWCAAHRAVLVILRAPGIYASDRLPLERLRAGVPVLRPEDDVFTNHIHADDLAAIVVRALEDDAPPGIYNASDDSEILAGDWLDLVAEHAGLARPARIARSEAAARIPPAVLSFMSESRRLDNSRLKRTLGVRLRYPTVQEGLRDELPARAHESA